MFLRPKLRTLFVTLTLLLSGCDPARQILINLGELCGHATYTVTTDAAGDDPESLCDFRSAQCDSLRSAINTANLCRESGRKTIRLPSQTVFIISQANTPSGASTGFENAANARTGPAGLPRILGTLVIEGRDSWIARDPAADRFRLFHVLPGARLTMNDLFIIHGNAGVPGMDPGNGGGIYNEGEVTVNNIFFIGNTAGRGGGAIYNLKGARINNCRFQDNRGFLAAAIYTHRPPSGSEIQPTLAIQDSSFFSNGRRGESYHVVSVEGNSEATIARSRFTGNQVAISAVNGFASDIIIDASTFTRNFGNFGASARISGGNLIITRSTFTNEEGGGHGAIRCELGTFPSSTNIRDSTIYNNSSIAGPGGISGDHSCQFRISNSIVMNNSPQDCLVSNLIPGGTNLSSDDSCTGFTSTAEAQLGPLRNNGGSTQTMMPDSTSPAVDAGGVNCLSADQRDIPRPRGTACDVGAVER